MRGLLFIVFLGLAFFPADECVFGERPTPDFVLVNFSPRAYVLIREALSNFKTCAPDLYAFTRTHVQRAQAVTWQTNVGSGRTIDVNESDLFSAPNDLVDLQIMAIFLHESRHVERPRAGEDFANAEFENLMRQCAHGRDHTPLYVSP